MSKTTWQELAQAHLSTLAKLPLAEFLNGAMTFRTELMTLSVQAAELMDERERANQSAAVAEEPAVEPVPRQKSFVEVKRELVAEAPERKERYRQKAKPLCKKYGLDATRDKEKIDALINAAWLMGKCADCNKVDCSRPGAHEFETARVMPSGEIIWRPCRVQIKRRMLEAIPAKYLTKTFADYEQTEDNRRAVMLAGQFIEQGGKSLYFYGGVGTGKTFLATLIAKEMIRKGEYVVFGSVPGLLDELKQTFNDPQASGEVVLRRFIQCDLLILDDIGVGKLSDWNVGILYQIIDGRDKGKKPTVFTSNYSLEGFYSKLEKMDKVAAERLYSRLKGNCLEADLGNRDRRQEQ